MTAVKYSKTQRDGKGTVRHLDRNYFELLTAVALSNSGELQQRKMARPKWYFSLGGWYHFDFAGLLKPIRGEGRRTLKAAGDSKCHERQYEKF